MPGRHFQTMGMYLGPTGNVRTFFSRTLSNMGAGPWVGQLGQVFEKDAKYWRLVQIDAADTVDYIDGGVVYWKQKSSYTVTADASDGEALANGVAGGCHQVIDVALTNPATGYFFVQCGGDQAAVVVAASAVAGDHLTGHASTDNVLTRTAAGTAPVDIPFATCLSTRGTTTSDEGASVSNSSKVRWHAGLLAF